MPGTTNSEQDLEGLRKENALLRKRLGEVEDLIRAIRGGEVDAFLVEEEGNDQVLVLDGADRPYRMIIEKMLQGAATITSDGCVAYANGRLHDLIGLPLGSLMGERLAGRVAREDRAKFDALVESARNGGGEAELGIVRNDGSTFPALVTAARLFRRFEIICLIITDLGMEKGREDERVRVSAEQVALAEADRRKDEFLAVLAHEIRNYLAPMRNGIQVLNLIGSKEEDCRRVREMMANQMESLIRLVDDLLDMNRVIQGKIDLRKEPTDLGAVIGRALESSKPHVEERKHRLEVDLPLEPLPVEADSVRLVQVLTNLINNAAKYTPPGGRIRVSAVRFPERPGRAAIRVEDTGVGLKPEMLQKIFELFAQGPAGPGGGPGGLGVGLALARRLAEMHGGTVLASSEGPGLGSCFTVELPLRLESGGGPPAC